MREQKVKAKFERSAVDHIELRLKQRTCHEHHLKPILSQCSIQPGRVSHYMSNPWSRNVNFTSDTVW